MNVLVSVTQQPSLSNKLKAAISHTPDFSDLAIPDTTKNQDFLKHFSGIIWRLMLQKLGLSMPLEPVSFPSPPARGQAQRESSLVKLKWDSRFRGNDDVLTCDWASLLSEFQNRKALAQ